jgi:hypothetical protein
VKSCRVGASHYAPETSDRAGAGWSNRLPLHVFFPMVATGSGPKLVHRQIGPCRTISSDHVSWTESEAMLQ